MHSRQFFIAIGLCVFASPVRAADPPLVRLVVLDTSSSMAGERLDTARKELLGLARQLPPTTDRPLTVIPFTDRVGDVRTFTDLASFETYLGKLEGNGGTRIAVGLERSLTELTRWPEARHLCVLLYTDGEDVDQAGIAKQEERLDALFAERQKRGLGQSVVFCKRWEQANAALLKQITDRGHARVVDAGTAAILPVALTPAVSVASVRWSTEKAGVLSVELNAGVIAPGLPKAASIPGIKLKCGTPGSRGDTDTEIPVGSTRLLKIQVPAPANLEEVDLAFEAAAPFDVATPGRLLLPLLATDRVRTTARIPPLPVALSLALQPEGTGTWSDPIRRLARIPLRVRVTATGPAGEPWSGAFTLQATSPAGSRFVTDPGPITTTDTAPSATAACIECVHPAGSQSCPVEVTVTAANIPSGVCFAPRVGRSTLDIVPPAAVVTTLSARVIGVSSPRWVDSRHALVTANAEVELRVDGPLPPDTRLVVRPPAGVRACVIHPDTIRSGIQIVRFEIEASVPAAPKNTAFLFDIVPPPVPDTVQVRSPATLRIDIPGPPTSRPAPRNPETPVRSETSVEQMAFHGTLGLAVLLTVYLFTRMIRRVRVVGSA